MLYESSILKHRKALFLLKKVLYILVVITMVLFFIFPVIWMILTSFKPARETFRIPPSLFFNPTLSNYYELFGSRFEGGRLLPVFLPNSLIVTIITTIIVMFLALFTAYGLTNLNFRWKKPCTIFIIATRMLPPIGAILPLFFMFSELGLLDTKLSLILVHIALNLPLSIWILIGFLKGIPKEIEECARVDGCSRMGALLRIVMPLAAPGLVAAGIFTFIFTWNDFQIALFLTRAHAKTLPLLALSFQTIEEGVVWGPMSAGGSLIMIPMILFVLFAQKYIIKGLTMGGVKG